MKYPVVLFTALFAAGISVSECIRIPFEILILYSIVLVISISLFFIFRSRYFVRLALSLSIYSGIFLTGLLYYSPPLQFSRSSELNKEKVSLYGAVKDINVNTAADLKFTVESDSLFAGSLKIIYKGFFICSVQESKLKLYPGNKIKMDGIYYRGRDRRNPGEFDFTDYMIKNGISGYIYSYNEDSLHILSTENDYFSGIIYQVRKTISSGIKKYFRPETAALIMGLMLADRSDIDQEVKNNFINSGTAHVLAVSGLNVGYIVLLFLVISGRFNLYLRSMLTSAGIIGYLLITGGQPSIARASIMALIIIAAYLSNRTSNILNSLSISALIMLIANPVQLFLPGFQLSFAAVLSTAWIYPVLREELMKYHINRRFKKIIFIMILTVAAQIGTLPFVLFYFSKLSFTSIAANLVVIPGIGIILGAAVITLIISVVSSSTALIIAASTDLLNDIMLAFVRFMGEPSYSFLYVNNFSLPDGVIISVMMCMYFVFFRVVNRLSLKIALTIISIICSVILISLDDNELFERGKLSCYMIDVGQGDSFLISFPSGKTALIDAGDAARNFDSGERVIEPLLNHTGIKQIDYAFITHLDADHYSGFVHLAHKGYIRKFIKPLPDSSSNDNKFEQFLIKNKIPFSYYDGRILDIDGARIYLLDNKELRYGKTSSNDLSLIIMVQYGGTGFLFMGDAGYQAEKFYINKYGNLLQSSVLKISHHGSSSATSDDFLYITRPLFCLVSAGEKNKYGHPSERVLDRINKINAKVFRTDQEGGVLLQSDGFNIKKINWKDL